MNSEVFVFFVHLDGIFDIQFEDFSGTSLARKRPIPRRIQDGKMGQNPPPFFDVAKSIYKKKDIL